MSHFLLLCTCLVPLLVLLVLVLLVWVLLVGVTLVGVTLLSGTWGEEGWADPVVGAFGEVWGDGTLYYL